MMSMIFKFDSKFRHWVICKLAQYQTWPRISLVHSPIYTEPTVGTKIQSSISWFDNELSPLFAITLSRKVHKGWFSLLRYIIVSFWPFFNSPHNHQILFNTVLLILRGNFIDDT